jgi:hypothetical protein
MKAQKNLVNLILIAATAFAAEVSACVTKNARHVSGALDYGIELNERFKLTVNSGDESAYRALRSKLEQYSEEVAMPCVLRAQELLLRQHDQGLMRKLLEFVVSYENSADETISMAVATVFATRATETGAALQRFSPVQRKLVARSIESRWSQASRNLSVEQRRIGEAELKKLLEQNE